MDEDPGPSRTTRSNTIRMILSLLVAVFALCLLAPWASGAAEGMAAETTDPQSLSGESLTEAWGTFVPFWVIVSVAVLLAFSAFFSGSETAFFSLHQVRLRAMREEGGFTGRLVTRMMDKPSKLLTTILVGNMFVNVLIAVLLGARVETALEHKLNWSGPVSYAAAVAFCTAVLVFFGEITPKIFAVRTAERFARLAAVPLLAAGKILAPIRNSLLWLTDAIFRVTRFHELRAAPFLTDEEFKSALHDGETHGVIEEGELQMIQGILEFSEANLREILTPRPDVVALASGATVAEALALYRDHEFSRMVVYEDEIDHVVGVLVVKDLLPSAAKGELSLPVKDFIRPAHFVPETMTVPQFVRDAQQKKSHLAIVVDEYGGTAGIVTLEDAVEEVVGDILDEGEHAKPAHEVVGEGVYRVDGSMSLDELSEELGIELEDEEHETVAGFLMNKSDKILEPDDVIDHMGARFVVERCDGKRVQAVRIQLPPKTDEIVEDTEGGS